MRPAIRLRAMAAGALASALIGLAPSAPGATPKRPEELTLGPLSFTPLRIERDTLACGIPVYFFENHDLPLLDLTIQFRMGTRHLKVSDQAAADLLGTVWRSGGTKAAPPDSLDERLAALDATISSWVGSRTGGVWLYSSSEDVEKTLPLWRDVVLYPRFDADRLAKARANQLKDLQEMNDDPGSIAEAHWNWLLWGKDYPGAHVQTRAEIDGVIPEALAALHRRFVDPRNAVIGVSGDFDRATLLERLNTLFAGWRNTDYAGLPKMEAWDVHPSSGVYLLRGDFEQSQLRIGRPLPGLTKDSADYGAADVLSFAFGYGRTFYRSRQEGLSYGSAMFLNIGDERSAQAGFGSCRPEVTGRLIQVLKEEMDALPDRPLSDEEVERARVFEIGTQVRQNETASRLVSQRVANVVQGRPDDFQDRYLKQIQSATTADLDRLARQCMLFTKDSIVLIVGNPEKFDTPLDSLGLGAVTELKAVRFGE